MASNNLDIGAVLRDPDFLGLSTIEKRKFLMDADPDFSSLPVMEQSKFIISLASPKFVEQEPSVWKAQGIGGPIGAITARAGKQIIEDIKEQATPTWESLAGPVGTPLRASVDTGQFIRRAVKQPIGETAKQFALSPIPLPVEKLGTQIGTGKIPEALGTLALTATEFALLSRTGKAQQAREYNPVQKSLKQIGKGSGIPYSETAVKAADMAGTLAPEGVARENLLAARDLDIAKFDLAEMARKNKVSAKGSEGMLERATNVVRYMQDLWEKSHKEPIARQADTLLDTKSLYDEVSKSLTSEAISNAPSEAKLASQWADRNFRMTEPLTVARADNLLREINADLKSPAAAQAYGPLLLRVKQVAATSLRDGIDKALESSGEIGVKQANLRYGALRTIAQRWTEGALQDAVKTGNTNLFQKGLHTYGYLSPRTIIPHGGVALSPSRWFGGPARNVAKGMERLGRTGISPLPTPRIPEPQPFNPSQLAPLGSPARIRLRKPSETGREEFENQPAKELDEVTKVEWWNDPNDPRNISQQPEEASATKGTPFEQEVARRDALLELRKNLRNPSLQGRAWLESKGVDFDKPGALAQAHRVINEELANLTGKGKKTKPKESAIPPTPTNKP